MDDVVDSMDVKLCFNWNYDRNLWKRYVEDNKPMVIPKLRGPVFTKKGLLEAIS